VGRRWLVECSIMYPGPSGENIMMKHCQTFSYLHYYYVILVARSGDGFPFLPPSDVDAIDSPLPLFALCRLPPLPDLVACCDALTAGDDEKRLILVGVQTEATGQVTAMVVARTERKPEQLCVGDEFQEVRYVVQNGLRTLRHRKDMRAKMEQPFVRVLGCPNRFWLAKRPRVLER